MTEESHLLHKPVLLTEAISFLNICPEGIYIDATFGRGGHSTQLLAHLGKGQLFAIDQDPAAKEYAEKTYAQDSRLVFCASSFVNLKELAKAQGIVGKVQGILFDLGVSSQQLDNPERGFSFLRDGPLDMRMNPTMGYSAQDWLARVQESELAQVLKTYGEERFAQRIARAILAEQRIAPIKTTGRLAQIVSKANPRWEKHKHPATRTFQAIRIQVNNELDDLSSALAQTMEVLAPGGRLVVISFHSMEDRIVKRFIRQASSPCRDPISGSPISEPICRKIGSPLKPTAQEISTNRRARSAVLRAAEKQ
jgi:16S rRNA (cytosine1402-N4)-methyltransferase